MKQFASGFYRVATGSGDPSCRTRLEVRGDLPGHRPRAVYARVMHAPTKSYYFLKFKNIPVLHAPCPIFWDIFHDFLELKIILLLFIYFIYILIWQYLIPKNLPCVSYLFMHSMWIFQDFMLLFSSCLNSGCLYA